MNSTKKKNYFLLLSAGVIVVLGISSCSGSTEQSVELPAQGLITTVTEVQPKEFKIEDETSIPDTSASLIIAKYLDGKVDTFTLAEARLMQQQGGNGGHSMAGPIMTAAGAGLLGYMLGRSMSRPPVPSAYTNQQTYNRVNQTTGSRFNTGSTKATRPSMNSSRSSRGFGGGRSSRGFGG
jgi:hypothetical protein